MPKLTCCVCFNSKVKLYKYGCCEPCYSAIYRLLAAFNAIAVSNEASYAAAHVPLNIDSLNARVECYVRDLRASVQ